MKKGRVRFNPYNDNAPNIRFSLRLTEKLEKRIDEYSNKCNISKNNLILKCIEYALDSIDELY